MEKIARGRSREAISVLRPSLSAIFPYCTRSSALTGLLYWLVYANKLQRCQGQI